jgi:hypothetical protein
MFANPKFGAKKAPKFHNSFTFEVREAPGSIPYLKAYIENDCDYPPKTLISINVYDIPHDAEGSLKDVYDFIRGVALTPEDAIMFAKRINMLVGEIFKEENYRR